MRRLADRLGVAPNALYTHVRGKADLVDGLIDQVYAGLELDPDPAGDWPEQLAAISRDVRAQLLAHSAVVPLALQQPGLGPHSLRLGEAIYRVLRSAGFPDQAVVGIVYAMLTYILGFVALEIPRAGTDPRPVTSSSADATASSPPCRRASSPTPSSSLPCWPASPPRTSSSSASASSWPACRPSGPVRAPARRGPAGLSRRGTGPRGRRPGGGRRTRPGGLLRRPAPAGLGAGGR
jgi:AcrR family transcriptional regulator